MRRFWCWLEDWLFLPWRLAAWHHGLQSVVVQLQSSVACLSRSLERQVSYLESIGEGVHNVNDVVSHALRDQAEALGDFRQAMERIATLAPATRQEVAAQLAAEGRMCDCGHRAVTTVTGEAGRNQCWACFQAGRDREETRRSLSVIELGITRNNALLGRLRDVRLGDFLEQARSGNHQGHDLMPMAVRLAHPPPGVGDRWPSGDMRVGDAIERIHELAEEAFG